MMTEGGLRILMIGTGGSSGKTLAAVEDEIRLQQPNARFLFADTQPFNLRSRGGTSYPGAGEVRVLTPEGCGIRSWTGSQTTNMLMNGGPFAYRRLIDRVSPLFDPLPDVVVACHDRMYIETAILTAARQRGVPTCLIQEGPFCAIGHAGPQARALRIKAALAPLINRARILPPIPDYGLFGHQQILAASDRYARTWRDAGQDAGTIVVTGVPRFDAIVSNRCHPSSVGQGEALRLLYFAQPFAAHRKVSAEAADAALDRLAEGLNLAHRDGPIDLTIRSHPRAGGDMIDRLRRALDFEPRHDRGTRPVEAAIADVHATIGHYSTALLESLMLGRPAICLPIPRAAFAERSEAAKQQWLETIGIPVCRTPGDLVQSIAGLRIADGLDKVRWSVVEEETGMADGRATARVAEAILRLAAD